MHRTAFLAWHEAWRRTVHHWSSRGIMTRLNLEALHTAVSGNSPKYPGMIAEFFANEPLAPGLADMKVDVEKEIDSGERSGVVDPVPNHTRRAGDVGPHPPSPV